MATIQGVFQDDDGSLRDYTLTLGPSHLPNPLPAPNLDGTWSADVAHLTWTAVTGAVKYHLSRQDPPGSPWVEISVGDSTFLGYMEEQQQVASDRAVGYQVYAEDAFKRSGNTDTILLTIPAAPSLPAPTNFVAIWDDLNKRVALRWDVVDKALSYLVTSSLNPPQEVTGNALFDPVAQTSQPQERDYNVAARDKFQRLGAFAAVSIVVPALPPVGFLKQFDFRPNGSPNLIGWTGVGEIPTGTYDDAKGYGWVRWWYLSDQVGPFLRTRNTTLPPLYRDIAGSEELVFRVKCPNGPYKVEVIWGDTQLHDDVTVRINTGPSMAVMDRRPPWETLPLGTVVDKVSTREGEFFVRSYDVQVTNGFFELNWLDARYEDGARFRDLYGVACGMRVYSVGISVPALPPLPPMPAFLPDPVIPASVGNWLVFGPPNRPIPAGATYVPWNCDYVPGVRNFGWWGNSIMDHGDRGVGTPDAVRYWVKSADCAFQWEGLQPGTYRVTITGGDTLAHDWSNYVQYRQVDANVANVAGQAVSKVYEGILVKQDGVLNVGVRGYGPLLASDEAVCLTELKYERTGDLPATLPQEYKFSFGVCEPLVKPRWQWYPAQDWTQVPADKVYAKGGYGRASGDSDSRNDTGVTDYNLAQATWTRRWVGSEVIFACGVPNGSYDVEIGYGEGGGSSHEFSAWVQDALQPTITVTGRQYRLEKYAGIVVSNGTFTLHLKETGNANARMYTLNNLVLTRRPDVTPPAQISEYYDTGHDLIYNPSFPATIRSVGKGAWQDPTTWDLGRVPTANDVTQIYHNVVLGGTCESKAIGVAPNAAPTNDTSVDTVIRCETFFHCPNAAASFFTLDNGKTLTFKWRSGAFDGVKDPNQFAFGLVDLGNLYTCGVEKTPFVRLKAEALVGATTLSLTSPVSGWRRGDLLGISDSEDFKSGLTRQTEEMMVDSVSADGLTVALKSPCTKRHVACKYKDGSIGYLPHVANLTRSVKMVSEDPDGVRGHFLITGMGVTDLCHIEHVDMGRTTVELLSTTNHIGRYPHHWHHRMGGAPSTDGCVVRNTRDGDLRRGSYILHGVSGGSLTNNVAWKAGTLWTEIGTEVNNNISGNYVAEVTAAAGFPRSDSRRADLGEVGYEGYGIWLRGYRNKVNNNVVAGCHGGYIVYPDGLMRDLVDHDGTHFDPYRTNTEWQFNRNEVYGRNADTGVALWSLGFKDNWVIDPLMPDTVCENFVAWNTYQAINNYKTNNVLFESPKGLKNRSFFTSSDYLAVNHRINNADVRGGLFGIVFSPLGRQFVTGGYWQNQLNFVVQVPFTNTQALRNQSNDIDIDTTGTTLLTDWTWDTVSFKTANLWMSPGAAPIPDWMAPRRNKLINWNGVTGANYRVYHLEQKGDAVPPATVPGQVNGSPEYPLTNQQLKDKYGTYVLRGETWDTATMGEVSPSDAVQITGVIGLVKAV